MGVVDVFDAVTTARPYRGALPVDRARDLLLAEVRVGRLSPDLVAEFLRLLDTGRLDGIAGAAAEDYMGAA